MGFKIISIVALIMAVINNGEIRALYWIAAGLFAIAGVLSM